jgi:hypothetical protein
VVLLLLWLILLQRRVERLEWWLLRLERLEREFPRQPRRLRRLLPPHEPRVERVQRWLLLCLQRRVERLERLERRLVGLVLIRAIAVPRPLGTGLARCQRLKCPGMMAVSVVPGYFSGL